MDRQQWRRLALVVLLFILVAIISEIGWGGVTHLFSEEMNTPPIVATNAAEATLRTFDELTEEALRSCEAAIKIPEKEITSYSSKVSYLLQWRSFEYFRPIAMGIFSSPELAMQHVEMLGYALTWHIIAEKPVNEMNLQYIRGFNSENPCKSPSWNIIPFIIDNPDATSMEITVSSN